MENIPLQQSAVPAPQVSNFCIILHKDGQVDRLTDRTLEEYVSVVQDASIAWIDWTAEEHEKSFEAVAVAGVFPRSRYQNLSAGSTRHTKTMIRNLASCFLRL